MAKPKLTKEQLLDVIGSALEDLEYQLPRAKAPAKKKSLQRSIDLWSSIKHHLTEAQK